jgi:hypothetical protein
MGYWAAGHCFDVQADADSAFWSAVPPVLVASDPPGVVVVQKSVNGWEYHLDVQGVPVSAYAVPSVGFADCTVGASALDGIEYGFAVGAVWIAVWAVLLIARPLKVIS